MKKLLYLSFVSIIVLFASCKKDTPNRVPSLVDFQIENLSGVETVAQEDTLFFKAKINSTSDVAFSWLVDGEKVENMATDSTFQFIPSKLGAHIITLSCISDDEVSSTDLKVDVYGKFRDGTFVLNEGNMTTENGSLIFISPKGVVTDSAYWRVNGTELGNVTQDLFIGNGKIYIISQNGKQNAMGGSVQNDGMFIIANAETLVKEAAYTEELSALSWPSHIAVLKENHVFIRDNKGVHIFNPQNKELNFIVGSNGATKNRMAVVNDKVFVPSKSNVLVLEAGKLEVAHTINMGANVTGVIPSSDGNLWVSTNGKPNKIAKVSSKDFSIIKENEITVGNVGYGGMAASPGITAKGDTLYYSNLSTNIHRHIFNTGQSELLVNAKTLVDNANIVYNTIAVHPITGHVYMNTIKGYGWDFLKNNISIFNFQGPQPKLEINYLDYTHFPIGVYFTYDFK